MTHDEMACWPWGPSSPVPLTEAELDAHIAEVRAEHCFVASSVPLPAVEAYLQPGRWAKFRRWLARVLWC